MQFESANPTVVKSIKQRDLLNTWLRLYAREQRLAGIGEYQPARLAANLPISSITPSIPRKTRRA